MSQLLQNVEFRRRSLLLLAVSVIACAVGFVIQPACGFLTLAVCLFFLLYYLVTSLRRDRQMEQLSQCIDQALYGRDGALLSACQEGELAILQTQLQKLLVKLRQSSARDQEDKAFLRDSIADISHQLRTPMTSLNLIAAMLPEVGADSVRQRELQQQLNQLLQRIDWLVDALLNLAKIDAGTAYFRRNTLDAAQVLRQATEPLEIALEIREITLQVTGSGSYTGDGAWSAEALGNILKNCMEHVPQGGKILVEISQTPLYTQLCLQDTGPGFAPDDLPHLFERFYKGHNAAANSFGIGLALAQRIISAQNGTIRAQNAPEGGALFTVRFYHGTI